MCVGEVKMWEWGVLSAVHTIHKNCFNTTPIHSASHTLYMASYTVAIKFVQKVIILSTVHLVGHQGSI